MAQYEATLTIKWYPELKHKTPDAELGVVIAHNLELLKGEGIVIVSKDIKPLPSRGRK
jgi:hypothetical protein